MPAEQAKTMGGMLRMGGVNYLALVAGMQPFAPNPQGNFIYMDTGMPHDKFAEKMKAQGIKVVGRTWPGYDSWSRISVGTPEETDACVKALKAVLA